MAPEGYPQTGTRQKAKRGSTSTVVGVFELNSLKDDGHHLSKGGRSNSSNHLALVEMQPKAQDNHLEKNVEYI